MLTEDKQVNDGLFERLSDVYRFQMASKSSHKRHSLAFFTIVDVGMRCRWPAQNYNKNVFAMLTPVGGGRECVREFLRLVTNYARSIGDFV